VQIHQTWQAAAAGVGVATKLPESPALLLPTLPALDEYQGGKRSFASYLEAAAEFLDCSVEDARRIHNGILVEEYPGIPRLVADIRAAGLITACLSNTNAPHWECLTDPALFPTVSGLDYPLASHNLEVAKPDHAIYGRFLEITGVNADEVVFFDDGVKNVVAAKELGWESLRIDPFGDPAAQMRTHLENLGILLASGV